MSASIAGKKAALRRRKTKEGSTCSSASAVGSTATLRTTLAPNAPWYTKEQLEAKPPPKPKPAPAKKICAPKPPLAKEFDPAVVLTWTKPKLKM